MSAKKSNRFWIVALLGLNGVAAAGVAGLYWTRTEQPTAPASAPVLVSSAPSKVVWADRFAPSAGADVDCTGCNVLMVSLDIFRPDHMPCFGYGKPTAPNICEMVENGVTFENFIVHAYQTPVSQMSLLTGRYPTSNGFVSFASKLADDIPYLPEQMKAGGYNTVAIGSSFEVMTNMSQSDVPMRSFTRQGLNPSLSFGRGFDRFVFSGNRNLPTDGITWIQEHGQERFFLWMILGTLHWPYGAHGEPSLQPMFDPPNYRGVLANEEALNFELLSRIYKGRLYTAGDPSKSVEIGADDAAFINSRYDFGLWTVDQFIGDLMAAIPPEVMQNTLIVLHGVHGEDLGEHGYFGHYDVYDTEVKSTLIVLNPRHKASGVRIKEQVEGVDLAPTLLDVLGLPAMPNTDGHSFSEVMTSGHGDADRPAFFERIPLWEDIFRHKKGMPDRFVATVSELLDKAVVGDTGLRTLRWKLLHRKARLVEAKVSWWTWVSGLPVVRPEWELYDLINDPTEQLNVADQHPEVVKELSGKLLAWEKALPAAPRQTVIPEATPAGEGR
ncbi:MAG: hypothetical protein EXR69_11970 [Myxococcales bacterium]|nr:hypothetical protein [Myxococcales bacterium]